MAPVNAKPFRAALAAAALAAGFLLAGALSAFGQPADDLPTRILADESFRLGVRAFHNGLFPQSVLYLEKTLSSAPEDALIRRWLGRAQYRSGLEEAALREWRRLLDGGQGDSLLRSQVQGVEFRRGLGREIYAAAAASGGSGLPDSKYVVAQELDSGTYASAVIRRPTSVRARRDGTLLIVSFGGNQVLKADINHDIQEIWRGGLAGFDRPFDVLETDDGSLFVSEYGANRIARCGPDGRKLAVFGSAGGGPGQLLGPQYLAADDRGYLYVSDWGNRRVGKFDYAGNPILSFGGKGGPGPRLAGPTGLAVRGESVFVADRLNRRIEVYDLSGNHLRSIGPPIGPPGGGNELRGPEGLSFCGPSTLLVADADRVLEFDVERETWRQRGELGRAARRLTGVGVSPNGETYAVDFDRSRIFVLSEMSALYSELFVQVERVAASAFPRVLASVSVRDRLGRPIVGLAGKNFVLTEGHRSVGEVSLVQRAPTVLEAALVVEPSAVLAGRREDLRAAVAALYDGLRGGGGALRVLAAGQPPDLLADARSTRLQVLEAAARAADLPGGPLDLAVYRAASELAPLHARRAVIYAGGGRPGRDSFRQYSLDEVTRYLANNGVAFYALRFDPPGSGSLEELGAIAGETGGGVYSFQAAEGVNPLIKAALSREEPLYTLRYTSPTYPQFGQKYIPLEVQVNLIRRSGRDELGYFAPLSE